MTMPAIQMEVFYDGAWNTIPAQDLDLSRSAITTSYGQPDAHGEAVPTELQVPLENPDLKYSPKDPNSELFGKIGKGTPLRLRVGDPRARLDLPSLTGSYVSTPDTAALDITGDIDVRIEVTRPSWRPPRFEILASKYLAASQVSWVLFLRPSGQLTFAWSVTGASGGSLLSADSTVPVPDGAGRIALRATLDVNNGASGRTTTFYTADAINGTWTQLGTGVVQAGTTSIFSSSTAVEIGSGGGGTALFSNTKTFGGRVHAFELRNGIAGTVVASPDFAAQDPTTVSFTDNSGLVWTLHGHAHIVDPSIRASCKIRKFAPSWNETARDARMKLVAVGPLASMGQGDEPLRSSLFRDLSTKDNVVAYWPMEDGSGATSLASGKVGHLPMVFEGAVTLGGYSGFVASQPIPTFNAPGGSLASYAIGIVPPYTAVPDQRLMALVKVPASGVTVSERALLTSYTTGTAAKWVIGVLPAGDLRLTVFDRAGGSVLDSGLLGFAINGRDCILSLWLSQVGANIDWQVSTWDITGATAAIGATLAGRTYGRFTHGQAGPSFDLAGTAVGHLAILNGDVHSIWDLMGSSLIAWAGETAAVRMGRLTNEAGVEFMLIGDPEDSELVGPQGTSTLLTLLDEAADVDLGRFGERRDHPSLRYRTRATLYNQAPALVLDMSTGCIANPFDPPLDDQSTRNDVTVNRTGGSSYRVVADAEVRYPASVPLNLYSDTQLRDQATWRLHLGTVDEHRIAALEIEMEHHPELLAAILDLEDGDLVRITNPPPGLGPGPLDLIALGWSDAITDDTWRVQINCAPGSPWTVGVISDGADEQRLDTDGSTIAHNFDAGTDTTLVVATGYFEDFEDDQFAVDVTGTWARTDVTAHAGTWSLGSPDIGDDEQADALVQIPPGTAQVGFWYRVSSEAGFDEFQVYVDGALVLSDDGDTGWVEVPPGTFNVVGAETITFRYVKDSSDSDLLDAAFVDDLNFVASHPRWTTDPAEFPFEIQASGVFLLVTAISGTASPQTFTVVQTPTNGVEKTIPAGADTRLAHPIIISL